MYPLHKDILCKDDIEHNKKILIKLASKIVNSSKNRVINDRDEILEFGESLNMLVPYIGIQEYRALSFAHNHNYQIISEDRTFKVLANALRLKPEITSNSIALINIKQKIESNNIEFYKKLHKNGYRELFNQQNIINFITKHVEKNPRLIETIENSNLLHFIIFVAKEYGWLGFLKDYYDNNYKFHPPMQSPPPKDLIALNIEVLLDIKTLDN